MGRLAWDVTAVTGKVKGHHTGPGMNMMTYIHMVWGLDGIAGAGLVLGIGSLSFCKTQD